MKKDLYLCLCCLLLLIGASACATYVNVHPNAHKEKKIPPGQVKKITGSKSARPYAPGQYK